MTTTTTTTKADKNRQKPRFLDDGIVEAKGGKFK